MQNIQLTLPSEIQKSEHSGVQAFKFKLFAMLSVMVLYTNYTAGQNFIIRDNSLLITPDQPTPFLQSNPYSTSTATNCSLEIGKSFSSLSNRAIFYGGNLGVSQGTTTFGNFGGQWSMTGAYQRGCTPAVSSVENGLNFMVTKHLWGNYSTFFGLRADSTAIPSSGPNIIGKRRSAVISWSYERNNTPNRLIFQTIQGIDYGNNGQDNVEHEWATILSNGNIGSGTSTPAAQLEVKHITEPLCMQIFDENNNSVFRSYKEGRFGIGNSASPSTVPFAVLDVTGRIDVLGSEIISSPSGASGPFKIFHLKDNSSTPLDLFYAQNDGNTYLDGALSIKGRTGIGYPLLVSDNSSSAIFEVHNSGDIVLPRLAGLAGSGLIGLAVDNNGYIYPGPATSTAWETSGNSSGSSTLTLGTLTATDIEIKTDNIIHGIIEGGSQGKLKYYRASSFGSLASPTSDYTITSYAISSAGNKGPFKCFTNIGDPLFEVNNTQIVFLDGILKMSNLSGVAHLEGNISVNGDLDVYNDLSAGTGFFGDVTATTSSFGTAGIGTATVNFVLPLSASSSSIGGSASGDWFGNNYGLNWYDMSDSRLKKDIKEIDYGLETIKKLKPKSYTLISNNQNTIGFIAQEINEVLPEVVSQPQNDSQYYAVNYGRIVPVLTKAIQEQQEIIDLQEEKLNLLNEKLEILFSNTLVKDDRDNLPKQKEILNQLPVLFQNHPNPFNGFT